MRSVEAVSSPQEQPPIDVIEPDPSTPPRPEEEIADEVRQDDPATPQP
jgi:hypothetical protein